MDIEELKSLIASRMTVDQFLDILGWGMYDLVEVLEDYIEENAMEFEGAFGE